MSARRFALLFGLLLLSPDLALANKPKPRPVKQSPPPAVTHKEDEDDEYTLAYSAEEPLPNELLAHPIHLTGYCKDVTIVEWRGVPISPRALALVDSICNSSFLNFFTFMTEDKHYRFENKEDYFPVRNICFLPYLTNERRGLNDSSYRFSGRQRSYDNEGYLLPILGYTKKEPHYTFMMNNALNDDDTVNRYFVIVLAHELFHSLSFYYHTHDRFYDNVFDRNARDEIFADQFTEKYYGGK